MLSHHRRRLPNSTEVVGKRYRTNALAWANGEDLHGTRTH